MKRFMILLIIGMACMLVKADMNTVDKYFDRIKVGDPIEYGNLKIFPILATRTLSQRDYVSLDEAMERGWLKIRESGEGNVNIVEVRNNGKEKVFILTGEMLTGAKQDRMIENDILLPAQSGWVK